MTETDMLVLVELVQMALPRLDFDDPNQRLAGNELLWLINHIGATHEYRKDSADARRFLAQTLKGDETHGKDSNVCAETR